MKASSTLGTCAPQQYVDGIEGTTNPATGEALDDGTGLDPCGLMLYFNETYTLTQQQPGSVASASVTALTLKLQKDP